MKISMRKPNRSARTLQMPHKNSSGIICRVWIEVRMMVSQLQLAQSNKQRRYVQLPANNSLRLKCRKSERNCHKRQRQQQLRPATSQTYMTPLSLLMSVYLNQALLPRRHPRKNRKEKIKISSSALALSSEMRRRTKHWLRWKIKRSKKKCRLYRVEQVKC